MKILITGAASGIGRATALAFQRDAILHQEPQPGFFLADLNLNGLEETAHDLGAEFDCAIDSVDLSNPDEVEGLVESAVRALGGLDVIVSNAGVLARAGIEDLQLEAFDREFSVNTRAAWLLSKAAFPSLKTDGGSIVATASMSATAPTPELGMYGPSKAALVMLIKQMALEWAEYGIRANCVSPGPTLTGMTREVYSDPEIRKQREAVIPIGRLGRPEDIANAIVFLSRPEASFITGVDLLVDGGMSTILMKASGGGSGHVTNNR